MKKYEKYIDHLLENQNSKKLTLYHGTNNNFNKFDLKFFNTGAFDGGWLGVGIYLTNDYNYAKSYGIVLTCDVKLKNPYIIRDSIYQRRPNKLKEELGVKNSKQVTLKLKEMGYDSVMLTYENSDFSDSESFVEVCVFDPNQIEIVKREENDED